MGEQDDLQAVMGDSWAMLDQITSLRDSILEHVGTDPMVQAQTLFGAAQQLFDRGLVKEAFWMCGEIVSRFKSESSTDIRGIVADCLFIQATILGAAGHIEEELVLYDRILSEFPMARHAVAVTLFNKALRLSQRQQAGAALEVYGKLIDEYRESAEPSLRLQVAMALVNRAGITSRGGRDDLALIDCTEVVERYRAETNPDVQRQWIMALYNQSLFFGTQGRHSDALRAAEEILVRCANTTDPALRGILDRTVEMRGKLQARLRTEKGFS